MATAKISNSLAFLNFTS